MCPLLGDGNYVLVKTSGDDQPQVGQVVVARHPKTRETIIKRVLSMGTNAAYLASENPNEGTDSRHFGSVSFEDIIGPVVQSTSWRFS